MATSMTPDEIDQFLDTQRTLILVTLRPDGTPVAHPMWFVREGRSLYINTRRDSLKQRNLARDRRTCGVVEDGESYFELRGVRVEGCCELVTEPEEIAKVQAEQERKNSRIGSATDQMPAWFSGSREKRLEKGERVLLRLPMERIFSWDFSKVRKHYQAKQSEGTGP